MKRQLYQIAIFTCIILFIFSVTLPVKKAMNDRLEEIKVRYISQLEDQIGWNFRYNTISPALINSLRIYDVSVWNDDSTIQFSADTVRLHYKLDLSGDSNSPLIINGLSMKRGRVIINNFEPGNKRDYETIIGYISDYLPVDYLDVKDIQVEYYQGSNSVNMNVDKISLVKNDQGFGVRIKGNFNYLFDTLDDVFSLEGALNAIGNIDEGLNNITLDTRFHSIASNMFSLSDQRFHISLTPDELNIDKIKDNLPLDLSLNYQFESPQVSIHWVSEKLIPLDIIQFSSGWALLNPWLTTEINGRADVSYHIETKDLNYYFNTQVVIDNDITNSYVDDETVVNAVLSGNLETMDITDFSASNRMANVNYAGHIDMNSKVPEGQLFLNNVLLPSGEKLSAQFDMQYQEEILSIITDDLYLGSYSPGTCEFLIDMSFSEDMIFYVSSQIGKNDQKIYFDTDISLIDNFHVDLWYEIHNWPMDEMLMALSPESLNWEKLSLENIRLNSRGEYHKSRNDYWMNIDISGLEFDRGSSYVVQTSYFMDEETIEFSDFSLSTDRGVWESYFRAIKDGETWESILQLSKGLYSYDFQINYFENRSIEILGNYDFRSNMSILSSNDIIFSLSFSDLPFDLGKYKANLSLNSNGRWSGMDSNVMLNQFDISLSDGQDDIGVLSCSGMWENQLLDLYSVEWRDSYSTFLGRASLLSLGLTNPYYGGSLILTSNKNESVSLNFQGDPNEVLTNIIVEKLDFNHIPGMSLSGNIGGGITLKKADETFEVQGDFNSQIRSDTSVTQIEAGIEGDNNRIQIVPIDVENDAFSISNALGLWDVREERMLFTADIESPEDNLWETGLALTVEGFSLSHNIFQNQQGHLSLLLQPFVLDGKPISPALVIEGEKTADGVYLFHEDRDVFNMHYNTINGDIQISSSKLLPISFDLSGNTYGNYYIELKNIQSDLRWLDIVMPKDSLNRNIVSINDGLLHGDIILREIAGMPYLWGNLNITDMTLDTLYTYKQIEPFDLTVKLQGDNAVLEETEIYIGEDGTIALNGYTQWEGWSINELELQTSLIPQGVGLGVQFLYPVGGLQLNGYVQGHLDFTLDKSSMDLSGTLQANQLILSLGNLDEEPKPSEEFKINTNIDLVFVTGDDVRFVLPNEELTFLEARAQPGHELRLHMETVRDLNTFKGNVIIEEGEIFYFNRSFKMNMGKIEFDETLDNFNPQMALDAELNTIDEQGNTVLINLYFAGSLFDQFEPRITSIPNKSESEVLALLGQPLGVAGDQELFTSLVSATSSLVGRYALVLPFEDTIKEALNLDVVKVDTELMEKILIEQLSPQGVYSNIENQYNLWRYLDGTSLELGKNIAEELFVAGAVIIDFDENSISNVYNEFELDFSLSFEMATPLFDIQWSYSPEQLNTGELDTHFVDDTSIGFEFHF